MLAWPTSRLMPRFGLLIVLTKSSALAVLLIMMCMRGSLGLNSSEILTLGL